MPWWSLTLLGLALLVSVLVAVAMVRHPILARMAARNTMRRPKQTSTVIAGLMVGTAIISAALVAGGSASYAIRGYVYQSLGHLDESVAIEGYPYFPQTVYDVYLADPALDTGFDGVSAHAIWQGAIENPRTGLFQPGAAIIGFEPERDAAFGAFELRGGGTTYGRDLKAGQAIITGHLADKLDARVGDRINLSYTPPVDPILPDITRIVGNLTAAGAGTLPGLSPGIRPPVGPDAATHTFTVNRSAAAITIVVGWNPTLAPGMPPSTSLHLLLEDPAGFAHEASAEPTDQPVFLNVTSPPDATLAHGSWTLTLSADAAVQTHYEGFIVVAYPVYDLSLLRERARALQEEYGDLADQVDGLDPFSVRRSAVVEVVAVTNGGRGDLFDFRDALFILLPEAQRLFDRVGAVNLVKFSNEGGIESGVHGTDDAVATLNSTLQGIKASHPDVAAIQSLEVLPLKQKFLAVADDTGQTLTGLLVFAGSLSIITGLLLITNIFTMLAEERRSELGMARAVGMTRKDLVRIFLFEGSLYAMVAAALGSILGLALARLMIWILNAIIGNLAADLSFPPIPFRPTVTNLVVAFSVGVILTFATIYVASARQARLNVVRAIRRIEEPERSGRVISSLAWGVPFLAVGLAALLVGWIRSAPTEAITAGYGFSFQVFGALLAVLGIGFLLRPWVVRRRLAPSLAGLLASYYTLTYFLITKYENISEANVVGPIRGVLLTLCVVVLVTHFDRATRLLGRLLAKTTSLRAVAMPAVSYPLHKKFRTGMTLAMFSVVILSIGFFSIFGGLFEVDPHRQTGGFDVEARPTLSVPDLAPYDRGEVASGTFTETERLAVYVTEDPGFITVNGERTGSFGEFRHQVMGFSASFPESQRFRLLFRDDAYADDEAAYQAVLDRDDVIIVSYSYSTDSRNQDLANEVGDTLELHLGEETLHFTIIGIQEQYHYVGVFLPSDMVRGLFPTTQDLYLYRVAPGVDPGQAAKDLERNYRDVGMDAEDSVAKVLDEQESFRQILGAMKLFLGLGLIVGVLSLGIVTSRSVLERRQEIGMLRALGFTGRQVRRIFFIEVTFTLALGAAVGLACAILVTYGLWYSLIRELNYPYGIPWGEIGILLGASYLVALLATAAPIGRSAKVAPAEALRYLE